MSDFKSNNSTEFIAMGNLATGYTVVPNNVMNDMKNLGAYSFAVLIKIFQYINSPDHKISIAGLSAQTGFSKDRVSKSIHELIALGYVVRETKKRGNLIAGYTYYIYDTPVANTTLVRNPVRKDTVSQDSMAQYANKENKKKENKKKENKVVDVDAVALYKTFKIEKRVMPHSKKLIESYKDKLDLDVFEYVFIQASEDSVKKKYNYMKELFEKLVANGVKTLKDLDRYNMDYKASKSVTKGTHRPKTTHHMINQRTEAYNSNEELEKLIFERQKNHSLRN